MHTRGKPWAVVLAGGDGKRLSILTTDRDGRIIPKQYCSLNGGASLLHGALRRARAIAPPERVCVVVAQKHQRWWRDTLARLPRHNVFVEPRNLGTGHGVLHAALAIRLRDPDAAITFFPADHAVADEGLLGEAVCDTASSARTHAGCLCLVGIDPDVADPDLGYIVPGAPVDASTYCVVQFVEKPDAGAACRLIRAGALWNSFIFSSSAETLVELMRPRLGGTVEAMGGALERHRGRGSRTLALRALYCGLGPLDFSSDIVQGAEGRLRVTRAPSCGWTDLGTPTRVAQALRRRDAASAAPARATARELAAVNLASNLRLWRPGG